MRIRILTGLVMAIFAVGLFSSAADAAGSAGKLYKWTDKDGNIHYSDQIPPEAKEYAREKINEQGISVERTDRALTPEERAAKEAEERRVADEAAAKEARRKADEALLNSYASEEDLDRAYSQRMDLLGQTIEARRVEINAREISLSQLVAQAADMERSGRTVSDALKQMITGERTEIERQKQFLVRKEGEKIEAKSDYERDLAKYKEAVARAKQD
jgi:chromosome segregation ATPase